MADLALRPLSLGEMLDRAFTIFRKRFGAIALSLVVTLAFPLLLLTNNMRSLMELAQRQQTAVGDPAMAMQIVFAMFGKMALIGLVFLVAMVVGKAAVLWIAHKAILGEPADAWSSLGRGLQSFFPLLGLTLVEMAIYVATEVVLYIPLLIIGVGSFAAGAVRPGAGFGLGVVVWMVAVVVAMLYVTAALFVTTSVLMAEVDAGVFRAIARSWELTQGRRGNILGMVFLVGVLLWLAMLGVSIAVGIVVGITGRGAGPAAVGGTMVAMMGLMAFFGVLVTGFFNVLQMTTYYDLRVRKEGLDLELASAAMPPA